jgi:GDSL-like Lipase/Acylhydrolase family
MRRGAVNRAALILYYAAFVIAVLAIAELAARWYVSAKRGRGREQAEILLDRWAAFRNSANFDRNGTHHNAQDFRRDQDTPVEKPPGTVRIFLIGGSVAYGGETVYPEINAPVAITNHETIDYFLEQRLDRAYPARRWEVINGAVKGYLLHQDLARILSVVLRYKPDAVILIDGVNDLSQLIAVGADYDPYGNTSLAEWFDDLTNPRGIGSLGAMLSTWLTRNSVLFRAARDRDQRRMQLRYRSDRVHGAVARGLRLNDLSSEDQARFRAIESQIGFYRHTVRQIHRVLSLDEIEDAFVLQPVIRLTRKPLAGMEPRLAEYDREVAGPLEVFAYETLYPEIARQLSEDRGKYRFLDFTGVFDATSAPTFTDYCHLTREGNRIVADRIFELMSDYFAKITAAAPTIPASAPR